MNTQRLWWSGQIDITQTCLYVMINRGSLISWGFLLTKIKLLAYWRQEEQWASIEIVIELAFPNFYAICKERSVSLLILKYKGKFTAVCFCKHNEVRRVNTEPWLMEEILVAILYPSLFFILLYNLPSTQVSFLSLRRKGGQHKHARQGSDRTDLLCKLDFTECSLLTFCLRCWIVFFFLEIYIFSSPERMQT